MIIPQLHRPSERKPIVIPKLRRNEIGTGAMAASQSMLTAATRPINPEFATGMMASSQGMAEQQRKARLKARLPSVDLTIISASGKGTWNQRLKTGFTDALNAGLAEGLGHFKTGFAGLGKLIAETKPQIKGTVLPALPDLAEHMDGVIQRTESWIADNTPSQMTAFQQFAKDLTSGAVSIFGSIGLGLVTGSAGLSAAVFGATQTGSKYIEERKAGLSPERAGGLSTLQGGIEGTLEGIGLDTFLRLTKGVAWNTLVRAATEAVQEGSQQFGENLVDKVWNKDKPLSEGVLRSALIGGLLGIPAAVSVSAYEQSQPFTKAVREVVSLGYSESKAIAIVQKMVEDAFATASPTIETAVADFKQLPAFAETTTPIPQGGKMTSTEVIPMEGEVEPALVAPVVPKRRRAKVTLPPIDVDKVAISTAKHAAMSSPPEVVIDKTVVTPSVNGLVDITDMVDMATVQNKWKNADHVYLDPKRRTILFKAGDVSLDAMAIDTRHEKLMEWFGIDGNRILDTLKSGGKSEVSIQPPSVSPSHQTNPLSVDENAAGGVAKTPQITRNEDGSATIPSIHPDGSIGQRYVQTRAWTDDYGEHRNAGYKTGQIISDTLDTVGVDLISVSRQKSRGDSSTVFVVESVDKNGVNLVEVPANQARTTSDTVRARIGLPPLADNELAYTRSPAPQGVAVQPVTVAVAEKQPWQMTLEEYAPEKPEWAGNRNAWTKSAQEAYAIARKHKVAEWYASIDKAYAEGKQTSIVPEWAKTLKESAAESDDIIDKYTTAWHHDLVAKAVANGYPVPAEVLADYPDLKEIASPTPATPAQSSAVAPVKWGKWIEAVGSRRTDGVGTGQVDTIKTPVTYRLGSGEVSVRTYAPEVAADRGIEGPWVQDHGKMLEIKGNSRSYYLLHWGTELHQAGYAYVVLEARSGQIIGHGTTPRAAIGMTQELIEAHKEDYDEVIERSVQTHGEVANTTNEPFAVAKVLKPAVGMTMLDISTKEPLTIMSIRREGVFYETKDGTAGMAKPSEIGSRYQLQPAVTNDAPFTSMTASGTSSAAQGNVHNMKPATGHAYDETSGGQFVEMVSTDVLAKMVEFDRKTQPKGIASQEYINALREDIRANGIKEPVYIDYNANTGKAYIGEGNTRVMIAKELGIKEIPAYVVRSESMTPDTKHVIGVNAVQLQPWNYREYPYLGGIVSPSAVGIQTTTKAEKTGLGTGDDENAPSPFSNTSSGEQNSDFATTFSPTAAQGGTGYTTTVTAVDLKDPRASVLKALTDINASLAERTNVEVGAIQQAKKLLVGFEAKETPALQDTLAKVKAVLQQGKKDFAARQHMAAQKKATLVEKITKDVRPFVKTGAAPDRAEVVKWWSSVKEAGKELDLVLSPMDRIEAAMHTAIKKQLDEDYGNYLVTKRKPMEQAFRIIREHRLTPADGVAIKNYAILQQGRTDILAAMGIDPSTVKELTQGQKVFYDFARKWYDFTYPTLEKYLKDNYNKQLGHVKNYWPLPGEGATDDSRIEDRFFDREALYTHTVSMEETKQRKGKFYTSTTNAFEDFFDYVDDAAYLLSCGKDIKNYYEAVNTPAFNKAAGDLGQTVWLEWLDLMARKGGTANSRRIRWLDTLRNNIGIGVMGFKLSTTLLQFTALADGMTAVHGNPLALVEGALALTDPQWRTFLTKYMPEVAEGQGNDPAIGDITKWRKWSRASFAPLVWADAAVRRTVAMAIYLQRCEELGIAADPATPNDGALEYAQRWTRVTQGSSMWKDQPLAISRGLFQLYSGDQRAVGNVSLGKTLLQFQSFMLFRWANIKDTIWTYGLKQGNLGTAASGAMWLLLIAAAAEIGTRRLSKEAIARLFGHVARQDDGFFKEMWKQQVDNVPFVGSIMNALEYDGDFIPAYAAVKDLLQYGQGIVTKKTTPAKLRSAVQFVGSLGTVAGVPGAKQVGQFVSEATYQPPAQKRNIRIPRLRPKRR